MGKNLGMIFGIFLLIFLLGCTEKQQSANPSVLIQNQQIFEVNRVIDGDTIEIDSGKKVRLICINTPEVGEYGYEEAKEYLTRRILDKKVRLEKDVSETDKFGRLLRYVFLEDAFLNGELVKNGFAEIVRYPPDTSRCDELERLETDAVNKKLGIWSD
ncbi:MAG: thermonuclease family protein [Candidatus Micrarchaeota archaeon]